MALWDLANADCVIAMGSNIAENHPIAFRFVVEAQRKGAKVIHIDPRFTRTGALADLHAPIRSGSDIAFLGGLIRYVIENDRWFKEFVEFLAVSLGGMAISLLCLWISHHVLGLTSALADNISANVVGLGLGTIFRFVLYRYWVWVIIEPRCRSTGAG